MTVEQGNEMFSDKEDEVSVTLGLMDVLKLPFNVCASIARAIENNWGVDISLDRSTGKGNIVLIPGDARDGKGPGI